MADDNRTAPGAEPQAESLPQRIWRSIFPRPIVPRSERERRKTILEFFFLHMRPVRVRRTTLPYTHTFGLGGSSLTLIGLMFFTGVLLMLAYEPTPERAYDSVVSLQTETLAFGAGVEAGAGSVVPRIASAMERTERESKGFVR